MKTTIFTSILIITLAISTLAGADAPVLTIDSADVDEGIVTINYTVIDTREVEFVTTGWQFSMDGSATWLDIDAVAIGNNDPKPAGSSFITWDTQAGANNLGDKSYGSVSFKMFVKGGDFWKTKSPMPTARGYLSTAAVNGKIYAIGGWVGIPLGMRTVEEYDPKTDSWRTVTPMTTTRDSFATAVVDGKIYAIGGEVRLSSVEEYNSSTDSWRNVAPMPTGREALTAAAVDGKIYAIGGGIGPIGGASATRTVEEYEPITDSWRKVADMPTARYALAAATVNGKIYAIGGRPLDVGIVEEYDPSTDGWRRVADMPTARVDLAAAMVDGKIYVIGGYDGSRLRTVEEYDPKTDSWRMLAAMPTARNYLAAASVDGKIYAIGGIVAGNGGRVSLNTVEEYTPPRESEIANSDSFAVGDQAVIVSPADGAFLSGVVNVMGTAMVAEGKLNSWILDFARGTHPAAGYTPIKISSEPVEDGLLGKWDTTAQDDGIYTLRLRVTDTDANTLETVVVVNLDNTKPDAPTVQINSPTDFEFINSNATITISGSTEANASLKSAHLLDQTSALFKDVKSDVAIDSSGIISGSVDMGELKNIKNLKLALMVQDRAGNASPQGISNSLTVDNDKPQVTVISPASGAYFNKAPITFSGIAADDISGIAQVEIYTGFGDWTPVVGSVNWTYEYTPPSQDVLLTVKARATDKAGNEVVATAINVFYFSTMPTANISAPVDNSSVSGLVNILGDADDTDKNYSDLSYKWEYAPGEDAQGGWALIAEIKNTPVQNDLLAQWQAQSLLEGSYTLRLTVKNSQSQVEVKRQNIQVKAPTDTISPGTVADLATSKLKSNSITLIWTAPGDDGDAGTVTAYEIRYSDVTPFNWDKATQISKPPIPQPAGTQENFTVTGLSPSTTYYFALKAVDEAGNWSDTSNIATGETTEKSACEPIQFALKLFRGVNLISIPVDLEGPDSRDPAGRGWRMSDLADHIGKDSLSMIIRYERTQGKFISYLTTFPDSSPANAFVRCGAGYIVVMKAEKEVVFEGNPCESEIAAPSSMPLVLSSDNQNISVFVITGGVRRKKTNELLNEVMVKIRNLRTGQTVASVTGTLAGSGNYIATFVASPEGIMTRAGDNLEITAIDKNDRFLTTPITYNLTVRDISNHLLFMPLQLSLPKQSALLPNYPNPFNPETWLPYQLAQDADVTISIYNLKGQLIRRLHLGNQSAGVYVRKEKAAYWDGLNDRGEKVSSGTYFVTLRADDFVSTRKIVTLK